jgi:hypothetical protein
VRYIPTLFTRASIELNVLIAVSATFAAGVAPCAQSLRAGTGQDSLFGKRG